MDRPARLPIDCPRCENRGVVPLDDDRTIACPLCNNWWTLCLEGVPTFVPIIRPYRVVSSPACGQLPPVRRYLRATRATITRRCSAATPTLRRRWLAAIRWARRTSRCRGASLSCATHMGRRRLATVQKMVGHESVTTTAGYDRRGDAAKRKAADLVHVSFFPRQT